MEFLWKLRGYMKMFARRYFIAFVGLQAVALLNLMPPWLIGRIVDAISHDTLTRSFLLTHLLGIFVAVLAMYGLRYVWQNQLYGASVGLTRVIRSQLFAHLSLLSPAFYGKHSPGDVMAHATNDLNAVEQAAGGGVMTMVDSLIAGLTVIFGMIFVVSGQLTAVALLPFPLLVWVTRKYGVRVQQSFGRAQAAFSHLNEEARDTVSGIVTVRSHALEARQQQRFEKALDDTLEANVAVSKVDSLFGPTIQMIYGTSFVITLGYGAWLISQGQITVGLFTSFTLYLAQLLGPFMQFGWQFSIFQRGNTSWDRLEKLFAEQPAVTEGEQTLPAHTPMAIEMQINRFAYPENEHAALENVAFSVPAGGLVGITGPTGGGKSTLFSLLLRQYGLTDDASHITLGGISTDSLTFSSLRGTMAWVPQKPLLFTGTIAENIAMGKPDASMEAIMHAADMAGIKEEIEAMKDGFQTALSENGGNLSGGQKQRITLARALLVDADILLLDDPFSALDMKTEARVRHNLSTHYGDKTVLLITQRLPNLYGADHILVLEEGRIAEQGSHKALMENQGWYATVYQRQNQLSHPSSAAVSTASDTDLAEAGECHA
ncbi:ABC transporter ATP-binding protein [Photobacterium aphoticum]|uniref:Multidrug resistance-like ATP-binding protein MdlA n=1 Tax=Photobacterium aphoticum TaxID=754436 RepID=A0A0J1GN90_9GAMM|nr:ABC transporter transmembrane domain-containing protein [Photobacterium aphoticum]KLV01193.1 multidrug ABC transporter ATP-binding protein [Photobacterium aphoticum]PSU56123.1 multidrug ABC transporter ATP-binding protein [Photobacterium aphoticum]GHA49610.1 multidrug ABC transporter ATP-binding protein [Photobacterium aphoticum]